MSIFSIPLSVILIIIMIVLLIIFCGKTPNIFVEKDGIFIKDFMYPSRIFAETIKSVTLCDVMPKVILRSNGYAGARTWKGFFRIKKDGSHGALLYLERYKTGPFIEIETTNRLYYINLKNEEQTRQLYDEIMSTVKFVDEKDLSAIKDSSPYKSVIIVAVFVVVVLIFSLIPAFGTKGEKANIIVKQDVVEIKGMYSIDIPTSEIDTVILLDKIPDVKLRTSGVATPRLSIGYFKLDDGRKCRMYLYNRKLQPYIEMRTANGLIFINMNTAEETENLFESMNLCVKSAQSAESARQNNISAGEN